MCDACPSPENEEGGGKEGGRGSHGWTQRGKTSSSIEGRGEGERDPWEEDGSGLRCPDKEGQAVVVPHGIGEGEGN